MTSVMWLLIILSGSLSLPCAANQQLTLSPEIGEYPLGQLIELLEDKNGSLTLAQVLSADMSSQFTRSTEKIPNFGFTDSTYWAKLNLVNPDTQNQQRLLVLAYPQIDDIRVYFIKADGSHRVIHAGDARRFADRPMQHIHFVFPFEIPPQQSLTLVVRLRNSPLQIPLSIYSPTTFTEQSNATNLGFGVFYGIMLVMVLYNLFIYLSVRDRSYLYYVLYIVSFSLFALALNGLAFQYLWPNSPWWANRSVQILISIAAFWGLVFTQHFLDLKNRSPKLNRCFDAVEVLSLLLALLVLVIPPSIGIQLAITLMLAIDLLVLGTGIQSIRRGYRPAIFFIMAWAGFMVGIALKVLLTAGVLASSFITDYSLQIGSAFEVILLSLALADRIKLLQEEVHEKDQLARRNAEKASQAKSIFIANVSHEIRTPLNAVLGYTQMLEREPGLAEQYKQKVRIIDRSGHHLLGLINDILDISKMQANAMTLHPVDFELVDLVEGIAVMFDGRCEEKRLKWHFINQTDVSIAVHGDQGKLRQILINLLGNAVKFTSEGTVTLTLSCPSNEHYHFGVTDTGKGIAPEHHTDIFKAFGQTLEGAKHGGTGLGLAIAAQQVELMGGQLTLDSEPGKGSHFDFTLHLPSAKNAIEARRSRQVKAIKLAPGVSISALVVDDIDENRDILAHMLKDVGIEVFEAENGLAALKLLHQTATLPDLIFMDIRMPIMNGVEAIKHIQQDFKDRCPICIVVTAHAMQHDVEHYLQQGFDHYIAKPFRFEAVYKCIQHLLDVDFDYQQQSPETIPKEKTKPDLSNLHIPDALFQSIVKAATIYEVNELESCLSELAQYNEQGQQLAQSLSHYIVDYDMDGLLTEMKKLRGGDE
ncbi:MAG: response regulator [Algicola sp.]|nr:response regulator [Algicola sp.]